MQSIYIEMLILATCFGVTLAAVWRLHQAETKISTLESELKQCRISNGP